jgi:hypothetical protein
MSRTRINKKFEGTRNKHLSKSKTSGSLQPADSFDNRIKRLHQNIGNQAMQRLCMSGQIQASLEIGQPNDIYEQEAHRVADQVMRMTRSSLSRKCGSCGKKEELNIRRKTEFAVSDWSVPDNFISSLGEGWPLDRAARDYFEPRFGNDLGHVRVHVGRRAAESAGSVSAKAYTLGQDIVFGTGEYQPNTIQGQRLLAHELTHTIQQANGGVRVSRVITPCDPAPCLAGPVPGSSADFHFEPGTGVEDTRRQNAEAITGPTTHPAPNLTAFVNQEVVPKNPALYNALLTNVKIVVDLAHAGQTGAVSIPGTPGTINVPASLEDEAADYMTKGDGFKQNSIGGRAVWDWKMTTIATFLHEFEHHRDWPATPLITAGRTNSANDTRDFKKELGDMDANLAEYPVLYDGNVKALGFNSGRAAAEAWIKGTLANGYGESLKGMITKLRCISPCEDVEQMVMRVFRWKLADWSLEKQRFLLIILKSDPYVPLATIASQLLAQIDTKAPIP